MKHKAVPVSKKFGVNALITSYLIVINLTILVIQNIALEFKAIESRQCCLIELCGVMKMFSTQHCSIK